MARTKSSSDFINDFNTEISKTLEVDVFNSYVLTKGGGDMYFKGMLHLSPNVRAWQVTGSVLYLNRAFSIAEGMMNGAENSSTIRTIYTLGTADGTYPKDVDNESFFDDDSLTWVTYPQWNSIGGNDFSNFEGGRFQLSNRGLSPTPEYQQYGKEYTLDQCNGLRDLTHFLNVLKHCPTLRSSSNYEERYQALLTFAIDQWDKWYNRGAVLGASVLNRSRTYMASHMAKMSLDLWFVTGLSKYQAIYENWVYDMSLNPTSNIEYGFKDQLRTHSDGGWEWDGEWGLTGTTDWTHAGNTLNLVYYSYHYGLSDFSETDMNKFTIAIENRYFIDTQNQYFNVDATSSERYDTQAMQGIFLFGEFSDTILELSEPAETNSSTKSPPIPSQAFAAALRDGDNLNYPEVAYTTEPIEVGATNRGSAGGQAMFIHC